MNTIRNIIFDLGEVILNIDVPRTSRAFASLTGKTPEEISALLKSNAVFQKYETGELSSTEFRNLIRNVLDAPGLKDAAIDLAWNVLLLDIPPARLDLIRKLKKKYRIFLLSNTSEIHIREVNTILQQNHGISGLSELFEIPFLSYEMGLMKPDHAIYHKVLEEARILASETLFLDDNADNVRGASEVGIQSIHVCKPLTILEYLQEYVH